MSQSAKKIIIFGIRIAIYSALMVLLNVLFMIDAGHETSTGKFGENSITEIMQELFLFLSGILFLFIGRTDRELKAISNLIALFFFMSFIREFNNQIDFWFWLVLPLFFLFGWLAIRDRNKLLPSTTMLMEIPAFAYLITGFLVTFVFSRFFGRTSFWMALLGEDYNRWAKNAAEEGIELLGYTLFFIAAIEILWFVYNRKKSEPQ
jgi:hypothetical protein